jgi:hypothetical protein
VNGKSKRSRTLLLALVIIATLAALAPAGAAASKGVVSWFGGEGTSGGLFDSQGPLAVAVNSSGAGGASAGDVYVLDWKRNRIQQFHADGAFVRAWGADVIQSGAPGDSGTGFEICEAAPNCKAGTASPAAGALSVPTGIAVDPADGSLYVRDRNNRRVAKYSANGTFLFAFGAGVADGTTNALQTCTATCFQGLDSSADGGFGPPDNLAAPSLAVAPPGSPNAGNLFVADPANNRIEQFSAPGASGPATFLAKVGSTGTGNGQFRSGGPAGEGSPDRLAVDDAGRVYAVDPGNHRVQRFTPALAFETLYGATQLSASPLLPIEIAIDPGPVSGGDASDDVVFAMTTCRFTSACPAASFPPPFATDELRIKVLGTAADPALIDTYMTGAGVRAPFVFSSGFAVNTASDRLYVSSDTVAPRVYVLDDLVPPTAQLGAPAAAPIGPTSATLHAEVNPNGPPDVSYRFEYSLDGSHWTSTPEVLIGSQATAQSVSQVLEPPTGLEPNTLYHVRAAATRPQNGSVLSPDTTFTTLAEAPQLETVGSPLRSATTARLDARLNPRNSATTYHFEYGDQGPCDANPCQSSADHSAGAADDSIRLVSQEVTGLQPDTTYHYRVVADNGAPGSPAFGEDMILTTRASDAPLSHGHFPGPPGSDRAWELVSASDSSGNATVAGLAFSSDGDRAIYAIAGGLTEGETGNIITPFFSQRPPGAHPSSGWQTTYTYPPRSELPGGGWSSPLATDDLSIVIANNTDGFFTVAGPHALFRIGLGIPSTLLVEGTEWFLASNDGSRVVASLDGGPDPAYPTASAPNYYDVSSGTPRLLGLLPGGAVPACGARGSSLFFEGVIGAAAGNFSPDRAQRWLSPDGSLLFFPSKGDDCSSPSQLYVRDIAAEQTTRISPPALSGSQCPAALLKSTPGAVFLWTQSRLVSEDTAFAGNCASEEPNSTFVDGDIYRYELTGGGLECLTCLVPGIDADVRATSLGALRSMVIAGDGSRVYFTSPHQLLAGAATEGIYRLDVASGELAYVAPGANGTIGEEPNRGSAATPDGSVIAFQSNDPALDSLTGSDNGGTEQDYLYDDRDRSLVCASCPQDGSAPIAAADGLLVGKLAVAPNLTPLSEDGDFAFATPTPLAAADQNTAGPGQFPSVGSDVYEWRDGRQLLVSDGLTSAFGEGPRVQGVSPSGRDVFFTQPAQLTADALDGIRRLYDARIGGGIEFPEAPKPCPLEVCQGTPRGAPEEALPGTGFFRGSGNVSEAPARCRKGKVRRKGRCVARKHKRAQRANHDRRNAR